MVDVGKTDKTNNASFTFHEHIPRKDFRNTLTVFYEDSLIDVGCKMRYSMFSFVNSIFSLELGEVYFP